MNLSTKKYIFTKLYSLNYIIFTVTHFLFVLLSKKKTGTDAIFALACNYPTIYYKRFVGSLRKFGYTEDIVLAVSPVEKMKPGVEAYVKETNVVAYGFDVDCQGEYTGEDIFR